jgi:hypothetical protein
MCFEQSQATMGYEAGVLKSNPGSDGVVETSVERRERRVSLVNQACHTPKTESRQSHGFRGVLE